MSIGGDISNKQNFLSSFWRASLVAKFGDVSGHSCLISPLNFCTPAGVRQSRFFVGKRADLIVHLGCTSLNLERAGGSGRPLIASRKMCPARRRLFFTAL
jgi:hypothetical protein